MLALEVANTDECKGEPLSSSNLQGGVRIACLDAWRGLAAVMVVLVHVIGPALLGPYPELQRKFIYRSVTFGNYGVQIFFVVSGLCIVQSAMKAFGAPSPIMGFLTSRFRRIYPAYIIISILAVAMSGIAAYLVGRHLLPGSSLAAERLFDRPVIDYASSIFLLQHVFHVSPLLPVFWTLCYEVAFYGLVAATLLTAVAFGRDVLVLDLCHILTLLSSLALICVPSRVPFPLDLWPEFGLGAIALDILMRRRAVGYYVLFSAVILQGFYAWRHLSDGAAFKGTVGMAAFVAVAFCIALIAVRRFDKAIASWRPVRLLSYIGGFSYSLYLSHWLVIGFVSQFVKRLYTLSANTYWVSAAAQVVAAILISRLFYAVAEKPFLQSRPSSISSREKSVPKRSWAILPRSRPSFAKAT